MVNHKKIVISLHRIRIRFNKWEQPFIEDMYNFRPNGFSEKEQEIIIRLNNKYRKSN